MKRATRKPTESLDAYDYYLRGLVKVRRVKMDANGEALQLFCEAIELDPGLACAYGMAAWCYVQRKARGWMIEHVQESAEATRLARKAVHLGGNDPVALCMGGYALAYVAHEFNDAAAFMDRGLAINPNLAQAWNLSAWLRVWRGEPDLALDHVAHAMRRARSIRPCTACREPWRMPIFSRAAMTWRRHAPKRQCAIIRLSCWQYAYSQPAMRSPDALSQHR
jgi:tetratricopeptide (TPR) repeat protein